MYILYVCMCVYIYVKMLCEQCRHMRARSQILKHVVQFAGKLMEQIGTI